MVFRGIVCQPSQSREQHQRIIAECPLVVSVLSQAIDREIAVSNAHKPWGKPLSVLGLDSCDRTQPFAVLELGRARVEQRIAGVCEGIRGSYGVDSRLLSHGRQLE